MRPTYSTLQSRLLVMCNVLVFVLIGSGLLYRFVIAPARRENLKNGVWRYTEEYNLVALRGVLEGGGDPNARDPDGWPSIVAAANNGNPACVKILLDYQANPELPNPAGNTALMQAARNVPTHRQRDGYENGYEACALLLVQRGANVNSPGEGMDRPLTYAISGGSVPLVKAMLEHGAYADAQTATNAFLSNSPLRSSATPCFPC